MDEVGGRKSTTVVAHRFDPFSDFMPFPFHSIRMRRLAQQNNNKLFSQHHHGQQQYKWLNACVCMYALSLNIILKASDISHQFDRKLLVMGTQCRVYRMINFTKFDRNSGEVCVFQSYDIGLRQWI